MTWGRKVPRPAIPGGSTGPLTVIAIAALSRNRRTPVLRGGMERRHFLRAIGAATGGIALAGCSGDAGTDGTDAQESTHTSTGDAGSTDSGGAQSETATGTDGGTAGTNGEDDLDLTGSVGLSPIGLEITNRELYETNGEVGLRGTVKNNGEQAYESLEAVVTLHDDQGDALYEFVDESEEADTDHLSPGESWQLSVVFEEAKLSEVTGYRINLEGGTAESTSSDATTAN